jgi:3-hydroxybutyryl-CoA dehydrogenase
VAIERIGVAGAGTMGTGIAQVAALGGFETLLHDPVAKALVAAPGKLAAALAKGAERDRWSDADAEAARARVSTAERLDDLAGCDLVIEACPEDLRLKRELFRQLADAGGPETILATNTSSLRVSEIAEPVPVPERVCGMHFFNPPALMRLVEVVRGDRTAEATLEAATEAARAMGREPVRASDSVGFIANRVNRPFSLESLRILEDGVASVAQIDEVIRTDGGYRMGPFELMDLVGVDVGLSVARSFYEQRPLHRWKPTATQERMVAEGRFGRKSGRGFYEYEAGQRKPGSDPRQGSDPALDAAQRRAILERVLSQLVNEASFALGEGVATAADIDTATRLGLNHPKGPFEWADELGRARVVEVLETLAAATGDERYSIAPSLMPP